MNYKEHALWSFYKELLTQKYEKNLMKNWTLPKEHIAAYGGSSWTSCSFCTCFPFTLSEHTDITLVLLFLSAVSIFNSWLLHQQLALLYEAEDKFRRLCSTVLVTFQSGLHVHCRVTSLERYVCRLQLQKNLSLYYKTTVVTINLWKIRDTLN